MSRYKTMMGLCCVLVCALVMTAGADTHYVAHGGQTPAANYTSWVTAASNIQDAVDAAGNDTVLVSNGFYNAGGTANGRVDFGTKNITMLSVSTNPYDTVIDGGGANRCIYAPDCSALVGGFVITNGWIAIYGGGVYFESSYKTLMVTNCIIAGNVADGAGSIGGGVMAYYTNVVTLKNCVIRGNTAGAYGGGVYQCVLTNDCQVLNNRATNANTRAGGMLFCTMYGGTLAGNQAYNRGGADRCYLYNVIVSNNTAVTDSGEGGGGMCGNAAYGCSFYNNSAPNRFGGAMYGGLAVNCLFSGNYAYCGGAAAYGATLIDCVISNNSAGVANGYGGGMYRGGLASNCLFVTNSAYVGGAAAYDVTLIDCVISNNSSSYVGGITSQGTSGDKACTATRCVIIGNTATHLWSFGGGALGCYLTNCLIVKNKSRTGPGATACYLVNCTVVSNESALTYAGISGGFLTNCIVWGNYNSSGVITNYEGAPVFAFSCTTPLPAGSGNISTDPQFVNFNGGNYRLIANSPCINTGTNQTWMTNSYDLDGRTRIRYGTVDMGAYEIIYDGTVYILH